MTRKIIVVALVVLCVGFGAFASERKSTEIPVLASFNPAGQFNLYLTGGVSFWGLAATAGAEIIIADFKGPVPLSLGIMGRGLIGYEFWNILYIGGGLDWGAAGLASLHLGFDFGTALKFDVYTSLGVGVLGLDSYAPFGIGFAEFTGVSWQVSDKFYVLVENDWIQAFALGLWGIDVTTLGIELKL